MSAIKIFHYIEQLDAFVVTDEYRKIAEKLNIIEWNPVVWIGRFFTLDNDFGEHWFDNWKLREGKHFEAKKLGIESDHLLIIDPERFSDGKDGPCHSPEMRKRFWTDVLKSLEMSYDLIFDEARLMNNHLKDAVPEEYIQDLEDRISLIKERL